MGPCMMTPILFLGHTCVCEVGGEGSCIACEHSIPDEGEDTVTEITCTQSFGPCNWLNESCGLKYKCDTPCDDADRVCTQDTEDCVGPTWKCQL